MNLMDIARKIGCENCEKMPEEMLSYYPVPEDRKSELCSLEMIDRLQAKFDFFQEYYEIAKEYWQALEKDPLRKAYVDAASLFMRDSAYGKCTKIPVPAPDGTPAGDLLQLFIHVPSIEDAYNNYVNRGFSHEETLDFLGCFRENVAHTHKNVVGRPALVNGYFRWLCLYTKARIFFHGGLNYEMRQNKLIHVLKNKESGALCLLAVSQILHRSGQVLGSAGYEEEEGAVETTFEETEDAFWGHPVENYRFSTEKKRFPKAEWELVLKVNDDCIGIHIPRNTDLSEESVARSLAGAQELAKRCYPEWNPRFFNCFSWMICPDLEGLMKPGSRVVAFGKRFSRYPMKGNGMAVFSFVFPQNFKGTYEELPEDTSLMRSLKKLYVEGGCILNYGGVIEFEKE